MLTSKELSNMKTITVDTMDLLTAVNAVKKHRTRITLDIDYNTKTIYINDKTMSYKIKGF